MKIADAKKKLHEFKFPFSDDLVALQPAKYRDESKLMVLNREKETIEHRTFKDILDYFDEGDLFILNDSKVFQGLLEGKKEKKEDQINVTLLRELGLDKEEKLWDVIVYPARKIRIGNNVFFGENAELVAEVIDNTTTRGRTIRFQYDGNYEEFMDFVRGIGKMPMPEYLAHKGRSIETLDLDEFEREKYPTLDDFDADRYQTIFAKVEGAKIAPSAGLHISKEFMLKAEIKGIDFAYLTIHPGLGNLDIIKVEDLNKHKPESDEMRITQETCDIINQKCDEGKRIVSVGAATMKAIETAVVTNGKVQPWDGWTHKFIFPPYNFNICNALVTGFHAPDTQMLLATAAFGGMELVMEAYQQAIEKGYKFMAYGDAMLII
jgi:S-adenosylmethionine:tRNA ribosyltransferase-isomerase